MGKSARVEASLLWKSEDGLYTVLITKSAFSEMQKLAVKHAPNEVGTCLIGYFSSDGFDAHVTGLAPLSSDSHGAPTVFHRGIKGLKDFFASLTKSGRSHRHYVGEWHSHPMAAPSASPQDDRDHTAIAFDRIRTAPNSSC